MTSKKDHLTMNIDDILKTLNGNQHYVSRYVKFINACNGSGTGYIEKHHICPKAFFPEYADLRSNKWNCAKLTARQHFIAHWMLAKAFGGAMWYGLKMMTVRNKGHERSDLKMTSSLYEKVRVETSCHQSARISGENHHMYGKMHSTETVEKMREAKRGTKNPRYGIPNSDEQKAKISAANKGLKRTAEFCQLMKDVNERQPVKTCPHCGIQSKSQGNMNRWHGDNCKQKGA